METPEKPELDCFIIARPRSGTTVLRSFLGTHPRIASFGELFNERYELSYYHYLRDRIRNEPDLIFPSRTAENFLGYLESLREAATTKKPSTKVCVYDVKYTLLRHLPAPWEGPFGEPNVLKLIKQRPARIIHLVRRNYLRMEISNELMLLRNKTYEALRNKYHFAANDKKAREYIAKVPSKIRLVAGDGTMARRFEAYDNQRQRLSRMLGDGTPCLELTYEELFQLDAGNQQKFRADVATATAELLGVDVAGFDCTPRLLKATPQRLDELIENHEQIVDDLRNTPYEWFLEDPAPSSDG